jgi:hypothetical protein
MSQEAAPPEAQVRCYAGASYPERPQAVCLQGEWHAVQAILQRWRTPQGIGFQVRTEDMLVLELLYNEITNIWDVAQVG